MARCLDISCFPEIWHGVLADNRTQTLTTCVLNESRTEVLVEWKEWDPNIITRDEFVTRVSDGVEILNSPPSFCTIPSLPVDSSKTLAVIVGALSGLESHTTRPLSNPSWGFEHFETCLHDPKESLGPYGSPRLGIDSGLFIALLKRFLWCKTVVGCTKVYGPRMFFFSQVRNRSWILLCWGGTIQDQRREDRRLSQLYLGTKMWSFISIL
jgi:hypothetical protein